MVTVNHEGPIQIIRDNPEVIVEILRTAFGVQVPGDLVIRTASEECTQIAPTAYRADNVVEICRGDSEEPTIAVVAETQQAKDPKKYKTWPVYLTALRARTGCPCYLIVICPKRSVAEWARQTIEIGHPGFNLRPLVVGPGTKPLVTTPAEAAQRPELAILGTLANVTAPTKDALEITHAALVTIDKSDQETAALYTDLVFRALPGTAQHILEALVKTGTTEYQFKSEPFLRHRAEGKAEGKAEGEAKMVLVVLQARGIEVSEGARERIMGCKDERQLTEWAARAATAESVDELFG